MSSVKQLFAELDEHLQRDAHPSEYCERISSKQEFQSYPFSLLYQLIATPQSPRHHPEGSVWNHTLLVVDMASQYRQKSKNPRVFLWTAMLHDIGKPSTTKIRKGRITSYDHDIVGARLAKDFLTCFTDDSLFIQDVSVLIRYHMHLLYVLNNLPYGDMKGMLQTADLEELALFGLCDRLGRGGFDRQKEEAQMELFVKKCKAMKGNEYGKSRNAQTRPEGTPRHGEQP